MHVNPFLCLSGYVWVCMLYYPDLDQIPDTMFTWDIKNLVIHVPVYITNIFQVSYLCAVELWIILIISANIFCTCRECSETRIRCLHSTVSWFLSESSNFLNPGYGLMQVSEARMWCTGILQKPNHNQDICAHVNTLTVCKWIWLIEENKRSAWMVCCVFVCLVICAVAIL